MTTIVLALACGFAVGAVFAITALPVPAPATAAGVAGVAGITLGWWLVQRLL